MKYSGTPRGVPEYFSRKRTGGLTERAENFVSLAAVGRPAMTLTEQKPDGGAVYTGFGGFTCGFSHSSREDAFRPQKIVAFPL